MSLLGWIKSAIGLDKAPSQKAAPQPPPTPPEQDGSCASDLVQESESPLPAPRSESPLAPADHLPQATQETPPSQSLDTTDGVEPALPAEVEVETAAAPQSAVEPERPPAIAIEPERPPTSEEIDRRRAMVRAFFNDYWSSIEEKPASFAERLDHAEGYINERVAAGGEAWRLGPATRKQLGLPPSKNR